MRKIDDVNLTADFYRIFSSPEAIGASRALAWPDKLRILGLWRTQIQRDVEQSIIGAEEGASALAEVNAAMRRAAGKAFSKNEQVA